MLVRRRVYGSPKPEEPQVLDTCGSMFLHGRAKSARDRNPTVARRYVLSRSCVPTFLLHEPISGWAVFTTYND